MKLSWLQIWHLQKNTFSESRSKHILNFLQGGIFCIIFNSRLVAFLKYFFKLSFKSIRKPVVVPMTKGHNLLLYFPAQLKKAKSSQVYLWTGILPATRKNGLFKNRTKEKRPLAFQIISWHYSTDFLLSIWATWTVCLFLPHLTLTTQPCVLGSWAELKTPLDTSPTMGLGSRSTQESLLKSWELAAGIVHGRLSFLGYKSQQQKFQTSPAKGGGKEGCGQG